MLVYTMSQKDLTTEISRYKTELISRIKKHWKPYKQSKKEENYLFKSSIKLKFLGANFYIYVIKKKYPQYIIYFTLNSPTGVKYYILDLIEATRLLDYTIKNYRYFQVTHITKHFIERFCERSPYKCTPDKFFYYFSIDTLQICLDVYSKYCRTSSGLIIQNSINHEYITYYLAETKNKQNIYDSFFTQKEIEMIKSLNIKGK